MARQRLRHYIATCHKGINDDPETANPQTECADALNVWAPNGRVEQRPGYTDIVSYQGGYINMQNPTSPPVLFSYTSGAFTAVVDTSGESLDFAGLAVGDFWYLGVHSRTQPGAHFGGGSSWIPYDDVVGIFNLQGGDFNNTNATFFKATYWNGTEWKYLSVLEVGVDATTSGVTRLQEHHLGLSSSGHGFMFVPPGDWAESTVNGVARYYIRFEILEAAVSAGTVKWDFDDLQLMYNAYENTAGALQQ
jgi:hypothetical protein